MPTQTFLPGPVPDTVRTRSGQTLPVPPGWMLLPPGDAALTRRVKAAGEFWIVQEKVGRRMFSRGMWAPRETIEQVRKDLAAERSTDAYDLPPLMEPVSIIRVALPTARPCPRAEA